MLFPGYIESFADLVCNKYCNTRNAAARLRTLGFDALRPSRFVTTDMSGLVLRERWSRLPTTAWYLVFSVSDSVDSGGSILAHGDVVI